MENILRRLKENNIKVNVVDNQLKLGVPEDIDATEILQEVRENKQGLIALIERLKTDSDSSEIMPVPRQEFYDVPLQQKAALLGYIYSKVRGSFNINRVYYLNEVDKAALVKALETLIERHECFRSTLLMVDGEVKQKIKPFDPSFLFFDEIDARAVNDQSQVISKLFHEIDNDHKPIDPVKGPYIDLVMKTKLVQFSDKQSALLLSVPHIIVDAAAMNVLEKEFRSLYTSFCGGPPADLSAPEIQIKDYVAWANKMLDGEKGEEQKKYWYKQIKKLPKINLFSELAYKNPYKNTSYKLILRHEIKEAYNKMSFEEEGRFFGVISVAKYPKGGKYSYLLRKDHQEYLETLARETNVSLSVVIITTFELLLYKLTDHEDIVLGLAVTQRDKENLSGVIGNFINTILLRIKVKKRQNVRELVNVVNHSFLEAYSYNLYPFERLLYETDTSLRSIGTMFLNISTNANGEIADIARSGHLNKPSYSPFDCYCQVERFRNGLAVLCDYQTRVYKAKTIEYIFRQYTGVLEALMQNGLEVELKKFIKTKV